MKVYVLEVGRYEDRIVSGVYGSPSAAMDAFVAGKSNETYLRYRGLDPETAPFVEMRWTLHETEGQLIWSNDGEWSDAAEITEFEVRS